MLCELHALEEEVGWEGLHFQRGLFCFVFLLGDLDRKTRIRIPSLETVMAQSTRLKEGERRVDDFERSSMFSLHEESWNTLYPIVIY